MNNGYVSIKIIFCHMSRSHEVILAAHLVTNPSFFRKIFLSHFTASFTARRFVFTLNNPKGLLDDASLQTWGATYLVYQEEVGENGTHHLQGYIEMPKSVRFTHFKGLEGAHFEKAFGTAQQCEEYCSKEETRVGGPYRFGKLSEGKGHRTDLLLLRNAIRDGKRGRDLFDDDEVAGSAIMYGRGVDAMVRAYSVALPRDDIRVILHYGPPGISHETPYPNQYTNLLQEQERHTVVWKKEPTWQTSTMDSGLTTKEKDTWSWTSSEDIQCPHWSYSACATDTPSQSTSREGRLPPTFYVSILPPTTCQTNGGKKEQDTMSVRLPGGYTKYTGTTNTRSTESTHQTTTKM